MKKGEEKKTRSVKLKPVYGINYENHLRFKRITSKIKLGLPLYYYIGFSNAKKPSQKLMSKL